ncbi:MAG: DUF445 domain-containing protein [Alphaproteobacteria bacterium]
MAAPTNDRLDPTAQEQRQRAALRRHRIIATGMLLAMGAIFVTTRMVEAPNFWLQLLEAGTEAALVGGLADWFAVTALFRRPLGLPIPHTALVPRNKDRIGEGLAAFVERNFLDPDLVAGKLAAENPARRLAEWIAQPDRAAAVSNHLAAAIPHIVESLNDREVRRFLRHAASRQLQGVDAAGLIGRAIALLTDRGQHHALVDQGVSLLRERLIAGQDHIVELVERRSRWWTPRRVDRQIAETIILALADLLDELAQRDHPVRRRFEQALLTFADDLAHDPVRRDQIARLQADLLRDPAVQDYLSGLWDRLRAGILQQAEHPSSAFRRGLSGALQGLGKALAEDAGMQQRLNGRIADFVQATIVPWRREIGRFIAEVVRGWDGRTVADRMELAVGRDLQYIRINGTLVGALVGCAIFLITHAVG